MDDEAFFAALKRVNASMREATAKGEAQRVNYTQQTHDGLKAMFAHVLVRLDELEKRKGI